MGDRRCAKSEIWEIGNLECRKSEIGDVGDWKSEMWENRRFRRSEIVDLGDQEIRDVGYRRSEMFSIRDEYYHIMCVCVYACACGSATVIAALFQARKFCSERSAPNDLRRRCSNYAKYKN